MECLFENLLEEVLKHRSEETEKEKNRLAFKLYDLSPAEINYITDFVTSISTKPITCRFSLIDYISRKSWNLLPWLSTCYIHSEYH